MPAVITSIDFDGSARILNVQLVGHISDCVDAARDLGSIVLGNAGRWHITSVKGRLPLDYNHPSEMIVDIDMNGFDS